MSLIFKIIHKNRISSTKRTSAYLIADVLIL